MGIFDALTTAVTGLQAQSFALQNISGNIANSSTTAFKETDTSFEDLVTAAAQNKQPSGSVIANSVATNNVQGNIQGESSSTDMAINGDGYFVVAKPQSFVDNQPVFSGVDLYTRRGDFQQNASGYLVNGAGYYLMGIPVDATTGNPTGSVPQVLQFSANFLPAMATTTIQYQANLPSSPTTTDTVSTVTGSELLNPATFVANPLAGSAAPAKINGTGATLTPDALAVDTGTQDISSLSSAGGTLVINGTGITIATNADASAIKTAINAQTATTGVAATLDASNHLVLTGANASTNVSIGGASTASLLTELGLTVGTINATNLLTQNAVGQGQTMVITVGSNPPLSITFGTNGGQIETLAQLSTALGTLTGGTAAVNVANGNITVTASNLTDQITVGGTATASNFGIKNTLALPSNGTVVADDSTTFDNESLAGGSVTAYDATGNPVNVVLRWAKTNGVAEGGTDTWQLFYQVNANATGTQVAWQNTGQVFTFNSSGQLSPAVSNLTLQNVTIDGHSLGNLALSFGSNGITQYADTSGSVKVNTLTQNGAPAGQLQSIAVNTKNQVVGTFSNGQTIPLADVTLATFNGQDNLQSLNGGAFAATTESGSPIYSATGQIVGSSLEQSNVDIATQFSHLIIAQQAYSANAKVMTTSDQMIQSLLTVIQ